MNNEQQFGTSCHASSEVESAFEQNVAQRWCRLLFLWFFCQWLGRQGFWHRSCGGLVDVGIEAPWLLHGEGRGHSGAPWKTVTRCVVVLVAWCISICALESEHPPLGHVAGVSPMAVAFPFNVKEVSSMAMPRLK